MTRSDQRTNGQRLRDTLTFQGTGEVPIWGGFSAATWIEYGDRRVQEAVADHYV